MRYLFLLILAASLASCWKTWSGNNVGSGYNPDPKYGKKVWGSKPVYQSTTTAKQILYKHSKQPLTTAGNIYAFGNLIFQVDIGRGIHIIDNTNPATADRIGFMVVNGCSQISIKGHYLYTNCLADLVTLDIEDTSNIVEVSRAVNAFPEFGYSYQLIQPDEKGDYECTRYDSIVVGWKKDSITYTGCTKY